jgi:hypothetical protein
MCFPQKHKSTTNKAARKKGNGKKQCGTSSDNDTSSHEEKEDEIEDDQSFNVRAELDVDEAPEEEDVVEDLKTR